jgi:hypothetical protein
MTMQPKVDHESETWAAVQEAAQERLLELRRAREHPAAELRDLDRKLGGIAELERLLRLPVRQSTKEPDTADVRGNHGFTAPRIHKALPEEPE